MAKLIMLAGNSGVGKTYIIQHFPCLTNDIAVVSKKTTRKPRDYEPKDRTVELIFSTPEEEILSMDYHYQYRDDFYGFNKKDITDVLTRGTSAILVVRRIDCMRKLKLQFPDTLSILVKADESRVVKAELERFGIKKPEIDQRLNKKYEMELEQEYDENMDVFNWIVYNYYDNKFLLEIRDLVCKTNDNFTDIL